MAKQVVNIGTVENDNKGDKLRDAFDKINDNFDEVYGAGGLVEVNTSFITDDFTAEANNTYFVDVNSGAVTITFPAASTGDIINVTQVNGATNVVTITSSSKINGSTSDLAFGTATYRHQSFLYIDTTNGWISTANSGIS
jgi:hypothetical protein